MMEGETRSYPPFTPTMSVIPNNAHQTNVANTQAGSHRMPVEIVDKQGNKGSAPNSVVSVNTPTAATSSAYAIAEIQMVDVQYGAVDTTHHKVTIAPPWPATSSTLSTKVTTQVPAFSGYPSNKTHTVVVDVTKENDLGIPALVATTNFGQTPAGEASGSKTPALGYTDDTSLTGVMNLKRLFKTLQDFANKRSRTAGEKVTQLINNLVAGRITVEKFNEEIVLTTDYPIKDCLIPLIKDNLPTLQREFSQAQKVAPSPVSSSPSHPMIASSNSIIPSSNSMVAPSNSMVAPVIAPSNPVVTPSNPVIAPSNPVIAPSNPVIAPSNPVIASLSQPSKNQPIMPAPPPYTQTEQIMQQNSNTLLKRKRPRNLRDLNSLGEIVSPDITVVSWQDATKKPKPSVSSNVETPVTSMPSATPLTLASSSASSSSALSSSSSSSSTTTTVAQDEKSTVYPEEWRHVDQMMWCIIGMVEKTRQAINTLRNKHYSEMETWRTAVKNGDTTVVSTVGTTPNANPPDTSKAVEIAIAAVKHQAEIDRQRIMAQADQRCKEEILKAKREMEERMRKVQHGSHDLLQEASDLSCLPGSGREISSGGTIPAVAMVAASGSSGSAVLDIERRHIVEEAERRCRGELEQMRREIDTLKESLKDQVDSEDTCWNCGRVARDKCSGCGKACYCGRFCQHKHWSRHQLKCLQLRGKGGGSNSYPALGSHQNSSRTTLQTVIPTMHTSTSHTAVVNANNDVIIIPSLQPTTNKSIPQGHVLVTSHPTVRLHQDVNHSPNMIVNNSSQQPAQIQSPVAATVISLDSSKSKAKVLPQDVVTISSPTHPPRLNSDTVTSSS